MIAPADLVRSFPGLLVWYGVFTRSWWAYVPGRPSRLVEAADLPGLARALARAAAPPVTARAPRPYR